MSSSTLERAPAQERASVDWTWAYRRRLSFNDAFVSAWIVTGIFLLTGPLSWSRLLAAIITLGSWQASLAMRNSRSHLVLGAGAEEYRRVVVASFATFGVIAIGSMLFAIRALHPFVVYGVTGGVMTLLASRWYWRQWLADHRRRGESVFRTVLLGSSRTNSEIERELTRFPSAGYLPVASVVGSEDVYETIQELTDCLAKVQADTVIVTGGTMASPLETRELAWALEPYGVNFVVAAPLHDVEPARLVQAVFPAVPLIHVEPPELEGSARVAKRVFDFIAAGTLILLLFPVLLAVALAVKGTSPGPILFRQQRVGLNGDRFAMLKFRSMVVNAEELLAELKARQNAGNEVLFKATDDPRITPFGQFLRRWSLDELPQLFNVLFGSMSLVGPRPPLPSEVEQYDDHVRRKFLVKPGITGLWQVSGRSELSWEESVRLDISYVENWRFLNDMYILVRTLRVVLARQGAY